MILSNDLVSQFVKNTNDNKKEKRETTVTGTVVKQGNDTYVRIDGSELLTPVSTTTSVAQDERVSVRIKNHSAMVIGNISAPSPSGTDLNNVKTEVSNQISEFEIVIADKVTTKELEAEIARIGKLEADNVIVKEKLTATEAEIGTLTADNVTINQKLVANEAEIDQLKTTALTAETADIRYATIENLDATNADVVNLRSTYATFETTVTNKLVANEATINDLQANMLTAQSADLKYANIDFANIGEAAIRKLFADTGLIKDLVVGNQTVTGTLQGVTIHGDLIEGNTIVANKLVVKGDDGLYYKLNTDGMTVEAQQTEYNSLNGSVILAKSITASKINVQDLVAFGATIGGFQLRDNKIYSGVKESVDNTTTGVYMDNAGQFAVGDQNNYIKYYQDPTDGAWKLAISADDIRLKTGSIQDAINTAISSIPDKDIMVGARNLQRNADFKQDINTTDWWVSQLGSISDKSYISVDTNFKRQGFNSLHCFRNNSDGSAYYLYSGAYAIPAEAGETFTVSFEYYISSTAAAPIDGTYFFAGMNSYNNGNGLETINEPLLGKLVYDKWTKVIVTGTLTDPTTTNIAFMIATDGNFDFYIAKPKLERGNVATDFTVAPEDVDADIANISANVVTNTSSIDLLKNEIALKVGQDQINNINNTITQMNTSIVQNADAIKLKADQTTVDTLSQSVNTNSTSITQLTNSIALKAEQSTVDSINQIVTNNSSSIQQLTNQIALTISQEELTNALQPYITNSELTLTSDSLRAEFKASGGYNLMPNGDFREGLYFWNESFYDNNGTNTSVQVWNDTNEWVINGKGALVISSTNNTAGEYRADSQKIKVKPNTNYTLSYLVAAHRVSHFTHYIRGNEWELIDKKDFMNITNPGGKDPANWLKVVHTFNTGQNEKISINFLHIQSGDNGFTFITDVMICEGTADKMWSPHPDEIYSGNTAIDARGITVTNGGIRIKNNAGEIVLSGDTDGNLVLGGSQTAGALKIKDGANALIGEFGANGLTISDKSFKITSAYRIADGDRQELIFEGNRIIFRTQNTQLDSGWSQVGIYGMGKGDTLYVDGGIEILRELITHSNSIVNGSFTATAGLNVSGGNAQINGNINATGAINSDNNLNSKLAVYTAKYGFNSGSPSYIRGRSGVGGFDFFFSEGTIRISFSDYKIYRVDAAGTQWDLIAG